MISTKPALVLHLSWIKLSVEFLRQYITNQKFCSVYWNELERKLSLVFFNEDSDTAKRYKINFGSNPGNIPCSSLLRTLSLPKISFRRYEDFLVEVERGNLKVTIQL